MIKTHIKKIAPLVLVVIMVVSVCAGSVATLPKAAAQTVQTDAMQFQYNAQHTGDYSAVAGPTASNGLVKWTFATGGVYGGAVYSSPAVVNNVVYIAGANDGIVYALNAETGLKIWSYATGDTVDSSPAVANGVVYIGSQNNNVYALDAKTGAKLWSYATGGPIQQSSPAVVNGIVYIGCNDGYVYALHANDGTLLWKFMTPGSYVPVVTSSPAVANGVVYVQSVGGETYAIDALTGIQKWVVKLGGWAYLSASIENNLVYIASGGPDFHLYALNPSNGAKVWSYPVAVASSSPAVANGVVYVEGRDCYLYAINANTGAKLWSSNTGDLVGTSIAGPSPAVANGVVYAGNQGEALNAFRAADGVKLWSADVAMLRSPPAVVNGVVYIGSNNGYVCAIGTQSAPPNHAPTAEAGADQPAAHLNAPVNLLGSGSDPDNDPLSYSWSLTAKPSDSHLTISDPKTAALSFTPDALGDYTLELKVTDTGGLSGTDTVKVTAVNQAPTANAGDGQSINRGAVVALDGTKSSDPENQPLTYAWSITSAPTGSTASLSTTDPTKPTFTPDKPGAYEIQLIVTDSVGAASQPDTVKVTVNDQPTADAGSDQSVHVGTAAMLDGSNSKDTDSTVASYAWTLVSSPAGSNPVLSDPTAVKPTFTPDKVGSYTFALKVTDDKGAESTNVAQVTITATNDPPTTNAGPDQVVRVKSTVTLDGRQSTDPNGDPITYTWTLVTKPHKSTAQLTGGTTAQPTFKPDKTGSYTIKLVVTDKYGAQSSDTVVVSVNNSKPPKPHK
ncbi:MAG: PKD domain-containing protein [Halobacteriota archaeon]